MKFLKTISKASVLPIIIGFAVCAYAVKLLAGGICRLCKVK